MTGAAQSVRALREHGPAEQVSCTTLRGIHGAARHDPGGRPPPQAAASRPLERTSAEVAAWYSEALEGSATFGLPPIAAGSRPCGISTSSEPADPERLASFLEERGIGIGRHYPSLRTSHPHMHDLGYRRGAFPVTEALARECLSLPIFPGFTETSARGLVVEAVARVLRPWLKPPRTTRRSASCDDVDFGEGVVVHSFMNLYGCRIGDDTVIGPFVEIQRGAVSRELQDPEPYFVCSGVEIEDEVFVGHGVIFVNDKFPRATTATGDPQTDADWTLQPSSWNAAPHWLGRGDPRRRSSRRRRARRRRRGRHAGRRSRRHGCRLAGSGPDHGSNPGGLRDAPPKRLATPPSCRFRGLAFCTRSAPRSASRTADVGEGRGHMVGMVAGQSTVGRDRACRVEHHRDENGCGRHARRLLAGSLEASCSELDARTLTSSHIGVRTRPHLTRLARSPCTACGNS